MYVLNKTTLTRQQSQIIYFLARVRQDQLVKMAQALSKWKPRTPEELLWASWGESEDNKLAQLRSEWLELEVIARAAETDDNGLVGAPARSANCFTSLVWQPGD
jgi:hypothetical protein